MMLFALGPGWAVHLAVAKSRSMEARSRKRTYSSRSLRVGDGGAPDPWPVYLQGPDVSGTPCGRSTPWGTVVPSRPSRSARGSAWLGVGGGPGRVPGGGCPAVSCCSEAAAGMFAEQQVRPPGVWPATGFLLPCSGAQTSTLWGSAFQITAPVYLTPPAERLKQ